MAKVFKKWLCRSCLRWYRSERVCACGQPLHERVCYSLDYKGGDGKRKIEDTPLKSIRRAERLLSDRTSGSRKGEVRPLRGETFTRLADDYFKIVSSQHADSGTRDKCSLLHLRPFFGRTLLIKFKQRDILRYQNQRKQDGASLATVARELGMLKAMLHYARKNNQISHDPFIDVKIKNPKPPIKSPPTAEEENAIWEALPESSLPLYQFLAFTGARSKEGRLLLKKDVDLEARIAWVKHKTREGDNEREAIILDDYALSIVAREMKRCKKSPYVFNNPQTETAYTSISGTFRRAMKRAGLDYVVKSPHDLRHLFISRLVIAGVPAHMTMDLARHSDPRTHKRYIRLATEHRLAALAQGRHTGALPTGRKLSKIELTDKEIKRRLKSRSLNAIAHEIGVSFAGLKKHCLKHGIETQQKKLKQNGNISKK